jgi:hypothetical protein
MFNLTVRLSDCKYICTTEHVYRYQAVIKTTPLTGTEIVIAGSESFIIHSVVLFDDMSIDSSKASSPQSGIYAFYVNFQYPLVSFTSYSSCLHLLPSLHVTSIILSICYSITRFRRQFLQKTWPVQLAFSVFIVCTIFVSSFTPCSTNSFLTPHKKKKTGWRQLSCRCSSDALDLRSVLPWSVSQLSQQQREVLAVLFSTSGPNTRRQRALVYGRFIPDSFQFIVCHGPTIRLQVCSARYKQQQQTHVQEEPLDLQLLD